MSEAVELEPCPFCGGRNITKGLLGMTEKFLGISESDTSRWFARVQCLDCGTQQGYPEAYPLTGPKADDEHDAAIAAWNRRALTGEGEPVAQDAKDAEITRLRADITALEDGNMTWMCDQLDKAKAENARLRSLVEEAGKVVEPLALQEDESAYGPGRRRPDDDHEVSAKVKMKVFRAARSLLSKLKGEGQ